MRGLTDAERECLYLLGSAMNAHSKLPRVHPADQGEFVAHLHACQNIVLARPATEAERRIRETAPYPEREPCPDYPHSHNGIGQCGTDPATW